MRGVGAEAVVGVVGPHLEGAGRQHQPLAGERLGERGAALAPRGRRSGARGRSSSRSPQPVPHELRARPRGPSGRGTRSSGSVVSGVVSLAHARHCTPRRDGPAPARRLGCRPCPEPRPRDSVALHGRRDRAGVPRRAADPARRRALRRPRRRLVAGDRPGGAPGRSRWSPATCGWTATSPSRSGCSPSACCGAASSPPRPRCWSRASAASSSASPTQASLAVVAPVTEEASKGLFLLLLLWWRRARARRHPRRHRLRRHGRHRLRLHREHPLPRRGLQRHRRHGPGRHRGADRRRSSSAACSARSPTRSSPRSSASASASRSTSRSGRRPVRSRRWSATCCAVARPRALERLDALRLRAASSASTSFVMVPAFVGLIALAVWARRSERRMLTAALTDAAQRGLIPATDIGWLVDLARPAAQPRLRQADGGKRGRARDARLPAGRHRARLPAPPLPARHRRRRTSPPAARTTSRGSTPSARSSPSPDRWCPSR